MMSMQPASGPGHELAGFVLGQLREHAAVLEATGRELARPFEQVLAIWETCIRRGGKLLLFGNGGSAADAQHLAAELVVRYRGRRGAIAAMALTTDSSTLTAGGNDFGFDSIFSRQIEALGRSPDALLGISTSGASANVNEGLRVGRRQGLATTGLIGGDGGTMRALCDAAIVVPSAVTARVQEMHILVGHMLCSALEMRLATACA